jgi:CubicO group peptidase (beta-lactamase class C family)
MMLVKKITTLGLLLAFFLGTLWAQETADTIVEAFRKAEQELVLLKNEEALIPLQRLDTLRIALVGAGLKEGCEFQGTLEKYTYVQTEMLPRTAGAAALSVWLNRIAAEYNLVIIGINDFGEAEGSYRPLELVLRKLVEHNRSIVVIFGGAHAFQELPWLDQASGLLFTPYNKYAHSMAAQLLFGGIGASGKLREPLNQQFRAGTGLFTQGDLRLRYSPPEVVGMNRQMLEDSICAIVTEGIAKGAYPGAQVVVAKDGHVVYQEDFGYYTYDSLQQVTTNDIYDYASLTKITGALPALMKLHGEGKFDLDAPMEGYFPKFRHSNKNELTFRAMLAHNARLRPWIPYWRGTLRGNAKYPWRNRWDDTRLNDFRFRCRTFKEDSSRRFPIKVTDNLWLHRKFKERRIYKSIKKSPLLEEPGYVYSGLLFYLLPEIVSDITGEDFESYLKKQFYHRLGAYTITYNPMRYFPKERIVPTERDTFFRMKLLQGTVHDEGAAMMGGVSGNAGLFSTANDLAKLMQLYLNYGSFGGRQLIAEESVKEFTRYQYPQDSVRRGLGFDKPLLEYKKEDSYVAKSASPASFGHSGYTGTFTWADPANGLLLVFFSNRVYPTRDNRLLYELNIRPRLHQVCYDAIRKEKMENVELQMKN